MKKRRFRLPLSIVILNLFLAILPVVAGSVIYNRILAVVSEDLAESNLRVLKQGINNVEKKYTSMGELFFPLIDNFSIIRSKNLKEPYSGGNVIRLLDVLNDFRLIQSSRFEDYILDSFLYFCTNDIVFTPLTVYRSEIFFRDQFQFTEKNQESWFRDIKQQTFNFKIIPQQNITYNGKDYHINIFIHSLYTRRNGTEVYYISLLNESFFLDQLESLDYSHGGRLSVLQDGELLYQYGPKSSETYDPESIFSFEGEEGYELQKDDRPERLISYVYSPLRRISYILEQNSLTQISRVLRDMSQIVTYGGIFYVFLASLLSFFLTKRSRITLYSSHIIARDSIMNALYHGDIIDESELDKAWKRLNLDNSGKYWGISLLAVNPFSSLLINELLTGDQLDINHLESTLNDIMPPFFPSLSRIEPLTPYSLIY
jgi:hypothetical protein